MNMQEKYVADALYLLNEFGSQKITFYDDDSLVHTMEDGEIEVATMYSDYTTYHVRLQAHAPVVEKKYADRGQTVVGPMSDEDYRELAAQLACFASSIRTEKALQGVDMKAMAHSVLDALFSDPPLGARPARAPSLQKNSFQIANAINGVLKKARRQAEFEWKEWADDGVRVVNRIGVLKDRSVQLAAPIPEQRSGAPGEDFSAGILGWFHDGLAPHGLTMVALAPLDEMQKFSIVNIRGFNSLLELLKKLNVPIETAPQLSEQ